MRRGSSSTQFLGRFCLLSPEYWMLNMAVEYTNRKGDVYYLHAGKTRTGKPRYFFSRKPSDAPVDAVPAGHEIYESPEMGLVVLRKAKPVAVTPFEREMVCDGIRRDAQLEHFLVDAQGNDLTVYLPTASEDLPHVLAEGLGLVSPRKLLEASESIMRRSPYVKMMRFVLVDENERLFHVERWCFLGGIDTWIFLDGPAPLERLVRKCVKHLGRESFFELM